MDTGGYSSLENKCQYRAVLLQSAITQGQKASKDAFDPRGINGYGTLYIGRFTSNW